MAAPSPWSRARATRALARCWSRPLHPRQRAGETRLYSEALRGDGERFWMQPAGAKPEADLDAYIARTVRIDPDVWVVEIEDVEGRHFLVEPVEKDG